MIPGFSTNPCSNLPLIQDKRSLEFRIFIGSPPTFPARATQTTPRPLLGRRNWLPTPTGGRFGLKKRIFAENRHFDAIFRPFTFVPAQKSSQQILFSSKNALISCISHLCTIILSGTSHRSPCYKLITWRSSRVRYREVLKTTFLIPYKRYFKFSGRLEWMISQIGSSRNHPIWSINLVIRGIENRKMQNMKWLSNLSRRSDLYFFSTNR